MDTRALDLGGGDFGIPIFFSSGHRTLPIEYGVFSNTFLMPALTKTRT